MKIFFSLLMLVLSVALIDAQSCYDKFMAEAKIQIEQLNFEKAINKYKAAKICPGITSIQSETIEQKVEDARIQYITSIEKANDATQTALEEAQQQMIISEANRLSFIATQLIEKNNYEEALQLALYAWDMVQESPSALVEKALGDAVSHFGFEEVTNISHTIIDIQISPNEQQFILMLRNKPAVLFDVESKQIAHLIGHSGRTVFTNFSTDGSTIATCGEDGKILLWSNQGELVKSISHGKEAVYKLKFSDKQILSIGRDKILKCWSLDGDLLHNIPYESRIIDALFSPNGENIICYTARGLVDLWHAQTGEKISSFQDFNSYVRQVTFSPDGTKILVIPQSGVVSIWNNKGQHLKDLVSTSDQKIFKGIFASNNQLIALASLEGKIGIWNIYGQLVNELSRNLDNKTLVFSPSNEELLFLKDTSVFQLWNFKSNQAITFDQHKDKVTQLCFSDDNQYILSTSDDQTIKIWTNKGRLVTDLKQYNTPFIKSHFIQNDSHILTSTVDGQVSVFPTISTIYKNKINLSISKLTTEQRQKWGIFLD